jgi:iron complex outermembrane receptor protein
MYRNLPILRNGDGSSVSGTALISRQLRRQHDILSDYDYEAEPVWTFRTGGVRHSLLTGFEIQHQNDISNRSTADLENITNIFDPVTPEMSTAGLVFLRDAAHSGFLDELTATYYGLYATDQIDLTQRLKLRVGGRQDWWHTQLAPQVFVPGRILQAGRLTVQLECRRGVPDFAGGVAVLRCGAQQPGELYLRGYAERCAGAGVGDAV